MAKKKPAKPKDAITDVPLHQLYQIEVRPPNAYISERQKSGDMILQAITIRGQIIDEKKKPFANRPVSVLLPNGDEIEVTTDSQGFFEVTAPPRARFAAVLMVLKSKSTSPKAKKH
jgi:hypothetical protein